MPRFRLRAVATRSAVVAGCVAAITATASTAFASSPKSYVLKHPNKEHCKAHYTRKSKTVKENGRNVTETLCVYVAPREPAGYY